MPLNTTIAWAYTEIVLYALLAAVASVLLSVESRTFYFAFYAPQSGKELASNTQDHNSSAAGSGDTSDANRGTISNTLSDQNQIEITPSTITTHTQSGVDKDKKPSIIAWRLHILTLLMFVFYILCGVTAVVFKLGSAGFADCSPCGVQGSFYTLAKIMMYCIFIYRLYVIYSNSLFQMNTKKLIVMAVICAVFWIFMSVANILTVTSVFIDIGTATFCGCMTIMPLAAGILLFDTVVSVYCCYLFVKPLRAMKVIDQEPEMYAIVIKYTILTFVAVISTILFMIVISLLFLTGLVALDAIINCICVFLFNKKYDPLYRMLCCGAHKCGTKTANQKDESFVNIE